MLAPISLVTTVYNRQCYLAALIESILAQTCPDFELLIWDDGSTDQSLAIAQQYAQKDTRVRVIAARHQGLATALSSAIAATTGRYLGWVDSDDLLASTALAETAKILATCPEVGLVYTNYEVIDEQGQSRGLGQSCQTPYSKDRLLVEFMTFHFRLMRRSVYERVGGINTAFERAEDYDLCLRLSEVTDIYHLERPLYYYRRHSSNVTNNQLEQIRWAYRASCEALQRRGLHVRYEIDLQVSSQFSLRPRASVLESELAANSDPKVSVIVPTYNRKQYLERALTSIFKQTYLNYEVIVVDDGSSDGTAEWLRTHYPQVVVIRTSVNQGAATARNIGIRKATGAVIAFLDSDDQWLPQYLQRQVAALQASPEAVFSYCNHIEVASAQDQGVGVKLQPSHEDLLVAMLMRCFIHTMSQVVVPAPLFQAVGLLEERLSVCHDQELYLRLLTQGIPVHVPEYLIKKIWLPHSLVTRSNGQNWLEDGLRLLDIFFSKPENQCYEHLRQAAEKILRLTVQSSQQYFSEAFSSTAASEPQPPVTSSPDQLSPTAFHNTAPIHAADRYDYTSELWLVTCYFNPSRYRTRFRNYQTFKHKIEASGLRLLTVECAFGDAPFELEPSDRVLQVRSPDRMWQKERLLNLAIAALPQEATKVAWLDCDILFANPSWAVETATLLDEFPVVQPFSAAINLPQNQVVYTGTTEATYLSFGFAVRNIPNAVVQGSFFHHGHPGYAWAARREVLQKCGLYDALIIGSADHHMAHAMFNDLRSSCIQSKMALTSPQWSHFAQWGRSFFQEVQGRVGVTSGVLLHLWHGNLANRRYEERHSQLADYNFDPALDLQIGPSGAWEWNSNKPELHQCLIDYFRHRQEDSTELSDRLVRV